MGLRSWLTPVADLAELEQFKTLVKKNPLAYGIAYVIDLHQPVPLLSFRPG